MKISPTFLSAFRFVLFSLTANYSLALVRHFGRKRLATTLSQGSLSSVADLRKEYSEKGIQDNDPAIEKGPIPFFKTWFDEACAANCLEPNAMCLSTCSNNIPTARVVLMKAYDDRGFVWYTNYNSRKSADIAANPHAALTFWWGDLERSVRIEGRVEKVSELESDEYFNSRPRGSQIGAWTSNQSNAIDSRSKLEEQERAILDKYSDTSLSVPRPPHWGGFRLVPGRVEFWKGRKSRLHDRLAFERDDSDQWQPTRLQP
jgi:pyridoxamine 5'-phosphate oxidase